MSPSKLRPLTTPARTTKASAAASVPVAPPIATPAPAEPEPEIELQGPPEEINDPEIILRLGILDERLLRLNLEKQVKVTNYNVRIVSLRTEAENAVKEIDQEVAATSEELTNLRKILSEKHQIDLSLYGYNEATGTLNLLSAQPGDEEAPSSSD